MRLEGNDASSCVDAVGCRAALRQAPFDRLRTGRDRVLGGNNVTDGRSVRVTSHRFRALSLPARAQGIGLAGRLVEGSQYTPPVDREWCIDSLSQRAYYQKLPFPTRSQDPFIQAQGILAGVARVEAGRV